MADTIKKEEVVQRFLDYVSFDTRSSEEETCCPSTPGQRVFAEHLSEELRALGLTEVSLDENGYLMATLPANTDKKLPVIGFIAHMDTSPDASGKDVKARIAHFDGNPIVLNEEKNILLSAEEFPALANYKGQDIIVTDGTTLLGADDKAGLCAIVSAAEYLLKHPEIQHGKLRIGFTPDEEIGRGADKFDVEKFGADFAYTVDGGAIGGLEYENFNAANGTIHFYGRSVHTGDAKNVMKNACEIAMEWQSLLPAGERPQYTEGYEGFYHIYKMQGDVENAALSILIRDHDRRRFEGRKNFVNKTVDFLNVKYGEGTVRADLHDSYYNMKEKIDEAPEFVELAKQAMRRVRIEPVIMPIRGGTDGARLSFMGLPCPNIFTGGHNYHGRFEYLPVPSLMKAAEVVAAIVKEAAER